MKNIREAYQEELEHIQELTKKAGKEESIETYMEKLNIIVFNLAKQYSTNKDFKEINAKFTKDLANLFNDVVDNYFSKRCLEATA